MSITKLNSANTDWLDSAANPETYKVGSIDRDLWVEASAFADDLLFNKQMSSQATTAKVASHFQISQGDAQIIVASLATDEGGMMAPVIAADLRRSSVSAAACEPISGLAYVNAMGGRTRITASLCEPFQVRTLVVVAMDSGQEVYASDEAEMDAVDQVVAYLSSTVHMACSVAEAMTILESRVSEIIDVLPESIVQDEEFSPNLERGLREGSMHVDAIYGAPEYDILSKGDKIKLLQDVGEPMYPDRISGFVGDEATYEGAYSGTKFVVKLPNGNRVHLFEEDEGTTWEFVSRAVTSNLGLCAAASIGPEVYQKGDTLFGKILLHAGGFIVSDDTDEWGDIYQATEGETGKILTANGNGATVSLDSGVVVEINDYDEDLKWERVASKQALTDMSYDEFMVGAEQEINDRLSSDPEAMQAALDVLRKEVKPSNKFHQGGDWMNPEPTYIWDGRWFDGSQFVSVRTLCEMARDRMLGNQASKQGGGMLAQKIMFAIMNGLEQVGVSTDLSNDWFSTQGSDVIIDCPEEYGTILRTILSNMTAPKVNYFISGAAYNGIENYRVEKVAFKQAGDFAQEGDGFTNYDEYLGGIDYTSGSPVMGVDKDGLNSKLNSIGINSRCVDDPDFLGAVNVAIPFDKENEFRQMMLSDHSIGSSIFQVDNDRHLLYFRVRKARKQSSYERHSYGATRPF